MPSIQLCLATNDITDKMTKKRPNILGFLQLILQQQQQGDLLSVMELGYTLTGTQVKFHC